MTKLIAFLGLLVLTAIDLVFVFWYNTAFFQTKGIISIAVMWIIFMWWVAMGKVPGQKKGEP
jgi:hypothetical protein